MKRVAVERGGDDGVGGGEERGKESGGGEKEGRGGVGVPGTAVHSMSKF